MARDKRRNSRPKHLRYVLECLIYGAIGGLLLGVAAELKWI